MKSKLVFLFLLFITMLTIDFSTEPIPPPYHRYEVRGSVVCDTLQNLKNFTVTLFGKSDETQNEFRMIHEYFHNQGKYVDITDSTGYYSLNVEVPFELDSAEAAVIFYGREPIFGNTISPLDFQRRADTEFYEDSNGSGCSSCTNESLTQSRVYRYTYIITELNIAICN